MSEYYPRILKLLEAREISCYKFAKMLGVPRSTFEGWIKGNYEPSLKIIEKTAELLDISIDEVIFERKK